jgi:Mg-chelatase subunit ChlI
MCASCRARYEVNPNLPVAERATRLVDLPVAASEDRVVGSLDLEHALTEGHRRFEPGLLANANRGLLYVDEINLLDDHLVDILLDLGVDGYQYRRTRRNQRIAPGSLHLGRYNEPRRR